MIQLVPVLLVDQYWPHLQEGMDKACRKGGGQYGPDWLWSMCRKGDAFLIVDTEGDQIRAAAVVQVQNWVNRTILFVYAACGRDLEEWMEPMKEFAFNAFSVSAIMFEGRLGWGKKKGIKTLRCVYEILAA